MGNNAKDAHMERSNGPLFQKSCKEQAICTRVRTACCALQRAAKSCKELQSRHALLREIDGPAAEKYDESENVLAGHTPLHVGVGVGKYLRGGEGRRLDA